MSCRLFRPQCSLDFTEIGMSDDNDLLHQLRIERGGSDVKRPRHGRWLWVVLATVVILLVVIIGGTGWWSSARAITVQTVMAKKPSQNDAQSTVLQATGYVIARREATVSAQIIGTLESVAIEAGEHVKKGQVLATLESSSQRAQLQAARATVRVSQAQLHALVVQLGEAERELQRQNVLVAKHMVSRQNADQARTTVDDMKAQLDAQRAQVEVAMAQERVAQVNYGYTVVRAPFPGIITQKNAQVGEIVAPAAAGGGFTVTGIATIVDMHSLEVNTDVNEDYISRITPGMHATVVLDAYPGWTIPAHVIAVVPTANRSQATVAVRVAFDKTDPRIIPNMGVRVSFLNTAPKQPMRVPKGVLVPASAVVRRHGQEVVFVVHGNIARAIHVSPAQKTYGNLKLLPTGVKTGAEVVIKPSPDLKAGVRVKVVGSS